MRFSDNQRHRLSHKTRGKEDFAVLMRKVSREHYSDADKVILIADNLNTHNPASFCKTFPAPVAFALAQKFEFHYTPTHGSRLNIAETYDKRASIGTLLLKMQELS